MEPITLHLESELFAPEKLAGTETVKLFDGEWKLVIETYTTREGCWNYTWGKVYDKEDNLVASIQRNYSTFFYSPLSGDCLMAGKNYDRPAILDLKNRTYREVEYDQFCWVGASVSPSGKTLVAWGCFWACPYEHRFYDLSGDKIVMMKTDLHEDTYLEIGYEEDEDDRLSIHNHDAVSIQWEGDDRLVWTKKILYYTDLQKRSNEADDWAEERLPMANGWDSAIFEQRCDLLRKQKRELRMDGIASGQEGTQCLQ